MLPELVANSTKPGTLTFLATLTAELTAGQTKVKVTTPAPTALQASGQFRVVIGEEIMVVVGGASSNEWTVERGAAVAGESVTPTEASHAVGAQVLHYLTVGALKALGAISVNWKTVTGEIKGEAQVLKIPGGVKGVQVGMSVVGPGIALGQTVKKEINSTEYELSNKLTYPYTATLYSGKYSFGGPGYQAAYGEPQAEWKAPVSQGVAARSLGAWTLGITSMPTNSKPTEPLLATWVPPIAPALYPQDGWDNVAIGTAWPHIEPGANGASGSCVNIAIGGKGGAPSGEGESGGAMENLVKSSCNIAIAGDAMWYMKTPGTTAQEGDETGNNIGIGAAALEWNEAAGLSTGGSHNIAIGVEAIRKNEHPDSYVAIGNGALRGTEGGIRQTGVGASAARHSTSSSLNTVLGAKAGWYMDGESNVAVGHLALGLCEPASNEPAGTFTASCEVSTGSKVVKTASTANMRVGMYVITPPLAFVGSGGGSGQFYDQRYNPREGKMWVIRAINTATEFTIEQQNKKAAKPTEAGTFTLTFIPKYVGSQTTALGAEALGRASYLATSQTATGYRAGYEAKGTGNVLIGSEAGKVSGGKSTLVGYLAGAETTGSGNVFIGNEAGRKQVAVSNTLIVANTEVVTEAWIRGDESGKRLAFFGATPVTKPKPAAGEAALRSALQSLGLIE